MQSAHTPPPAPAALDAAGRRLLWRCRRGMKELDLLLGYYARATLAGASAGERAAFAELLALPDPLLAAFLLGELEPEPAHLAQLVGRIRALCRRGPAAALFSQ